MSTALGQSYGTAKVSLPEFVLDQQITLIKSRNDKPELPTGIEILDRHILGLHRRQVTIIAGRPGEGKSSVATAIAMHLADMGKKVLYLSMEMPAGDILERMMCGFCDIDAGDLQRGKLPSDFDVRVKTFRDFLTRTQLRIKDGWGYDLEEVRHLLDEESGPHKPDVMVIDHVNKVRMGKYPTKREAISEYASEVERLSIQHNMATLLLAQINRDALKNKNSKPSLENLKECGDLEVTAATVIMLQWKTLDRSQKDMTETAFDFHIEKQRYGQAGTTIRVDFHAAKNKFVWAEDNLFNPTENVNGSAPAIPIENLIPQTPQEEAVKETFRADING